MCNLYSQRKGQAEIFAFTRAMRDSIGNLPPLPGIFPDYLAPIRAQRAGWLAAPRIVSAGALLTVNPPLLRYRRVPTE